MEETNILEILNYIKKRRTLIIIIVIGMILLSIIYISKNNNVNFTASTNITIMGVKNNGKDDELFYVDNTLVNTYSNLIKSKVVLNKVIEELSLNININALKKSISIITEPNNALVKVNVTYTDKEETIKIANSVVNHFSNFDTNNLIKVNIIDIADSATQNNKNTDKVFILAIFCGIILSVGIILIQYYFDDTIKSLEFIKKNLNIKLLGKIHNTKNKKIKDEDYKILLNKLDLENNKLLITSSTNKNNKEEVSYNIAKKLSDKNNKVLLLDCNIYSDYLHTKININTNNLSIIKYNDKYNDLDKIINNKKYDYYIINGTHTLGIHNNLEISKFCNNIIIVSKMNVDKYKYLKETKEIYEHNSNNIIGLVILDTELTKRQEKEYFN